MGLNLEQEEAKSLISDFIKNETGFFGLLGAGGTGKTYLITSLEESDKYQFLAPTNKAVNVLRSGLIKNGAIKPKVKTIDSFFSLRMKKDENNETIFNYKQPTADKLPKVIIVDECSLLTKKHIELLKNLAAPRPIILLGDDMQLPPVEGEDDSVFKDVDGFNKSVSFSIMNKNYTLTKQNRQTQESDLFKLINGFRHHMTKRIDVKKMASIKKNNIDILYLHQNSEELSNLIDKLEVVAVTYKNYTSDLFNYKIGRIKTKNERYNIREINNGDKLIFHKFYMRDKVTFYTSEIIEVVEVFEELVEVKIPRKEKTLNTIQRKAIVKNELGFDKEIWLKNSDFLTKVREACNYLKGKYEDKEYIAEINTFYNDFKNGFADLKKPYALTAHKSQGSTYSNVIIPVYDYYKKEHQDVNQLIYVAMSRASERIIFVDGFCHFNNSSRRVMFTEEERCLIAGSQYWRCNSCHIEIFDAKYDIDHIKPLGSLNKKGEIEGTNRIDNLQALCKQCHKNKTHNR
jgi:exodeoxyribonuclease V